MRFNCKKKSNKICNAMRKEADILYSEIDIY